MGMTVNGPYEQTLNTLSTVELTWKLVEIGQAVSEELFNNVMIL